MKLRLNSTMEAPHNELFDLIDSLQQFAMSGDIDPQLKWDTSQTWEEAQRMPAKPGRREHGTDFNVVLPGVALAREALCNLPPQR